MLQLLYILKNKKQNKEVNKEPDKEVNKEPDKEVNKEPDKEVNKESDKEVNKEPDKIEFNKLISLDKTNLIVINKFNYVINLKRREDRWNNFLNNVKKTNMKDLNFIKFEAFDGMNYLDELKRINYTSTLYIKNIINSCKKHKIIFHKCGELGCLMSHLFLLETIINNDDIKENDYVNIYEDDIEFCDNFETNYTLLNNIDLNKLNLDFLYTGGRHFKNYNRKHISMEETYYKNIFYRKPNFEEKNLGDWDRCTFSYIIKKSCCIKILENISKSFEKNEGILAIDHLYVRKMYKIRMFDFLPHLFYCTLRKESDIQTVKKNIQF